MTRWLILAILCSPLAFADTSLQILTPKKTLTLTLEQLKSKLTPQVVEIVDPNYKRKIAFDAFPLSEVLRLADFAAGDSADEIVFTATDGYSPNMPFSALKSYSAFLTYQEHGKSGKFPLIDQGKSKLSPAPYYLVWKEGGTIADKVPWPWQLVKIEAVQFAQKYPKVFPKAAPLGSPVRKGFEIFKAECIRCHSINLEGGEVGPELNAPKSVTEYWRPDVLADFIRNAPSFRYKTKMPSFEKQLSSGQVSDLITYLRYMAKH
jgi:mono/diheme cytochrome c family protein